MTSSQSIAQSTDAASRQKLLVIALSYVAFVVLGIPDGMAGVAFPSMRTEFGLGLQAFGWLFVASTTGYLISSMLVGRLLIRFPMSTVLVFAAIVRSIALMGYVVMPTWMLVVSSALLVGFASGMIDAGLNTWFAMRFSPRAMNWLHASFGLGAMLGPIILGIVLSGALTWRWGYAVIVVLQLIVAMLVFVTRRFWGIPPTVGVAQEGEAPRRKITASETLKHAAVWLGIAVFFVYTGAELAAGNWSFTLFTEGRGVSAAQASLWVSIYWATFTLGRILFGVFTFKSISNVLRICLLVAVGATIAYAWAPGAYSGFIGLAVLGFAVAPVFPLLVSETPMRLGAGFAQHAIGYQVGAAGLGGALIPTVAGFLAERISLEAIPVYLVILMVLLVFLHEAMVRTHISDSESHVTPQISPAK